MFLWLEQRIKVKKFFNHPLFPRGIAAWSFFPAVLAFILFFCQIGTGILLLFSVKEPKDIKGLSSFLRNLHGIGGNFLLLSLLLYLCLELYKGGYRKPGELVWMNGILLCFFCFMSFFTGSILLANARSQKTLEIFFMVLYKFPLIGPYFYKLLQSNSPSDLWHRFYILHISILPLFIIVALFFYIWLLYRKSAALSEIKTP